MRHGIALWRDIGCGAPVLPVAGLAFAGLSSGTHALPAGENDGVPERSGHRTAGCAMIQRLNMV